MSYVAFNAGHRHLDSYECACFCMCVCLCVCVCVCVCMCVVRMYICICVFELWGDGSGLCVCVWEGEGVGMPAEASGWKLRFVLWCIIISLFTHITVLSNEKNFVFFSQLRLIIYGKGKSELRQANWKRTAKPFKDKVKFRFKLCARRLKFTLTKQHIALQKSSQLVSFHLFVNHRSLIGWSWPRIFVFHEYIGTYCSSK